MKTRYQLALALENVNDLNGAKEQLMVILRDLDHYNALAYNEIGRVILELGPTNMEDFQAAVESFKTAIKLDPDMAGAEKNLALAMRMLATSRRGRDAAALARLGRARNRENRVISTFFANQWSSRGITISSANSLSFLR